MAISRIAGQMLQTNLERDGVNLSFSNLDLGNSTPILYLDVGNNQVGINNDSPSYTLDVTGDINATSNVYASNLSATANVTAGNVLTSNVYSSNRKHTIQNFTFTSNLQKRIIIPQTKTSTHNNVSIKLSILQSATNGSSTDVINIEGYANTSGNSGKNIDLSSPSGPNMNP